MSLGYIHDGYTAPAFIAGVDRLYPSLRFTHRPMRSRDLVVWRHGVRQLDTLETEAKTDEVLAERIKSWDLVDHKGKGLVISAEVMSNLQPFLRERLVGIVFGSSAPDVDPQAPSKEIAALAEDKFRGGDPG